MADNVAPTNPGAPGEHRPPRPATAAPNRPPASGPTAGAVLARRAPPGRPGAPLAAWAVAPRRDPAPANVDNGPSRPGEPASSDVDTRPAARPGAVPGNPASGGRRSAVHDIPTPMPIPLAARKPIQPRKIPVPVLGSVLSAEESERLVTDTERLAAKAAFEEVARAKRASDRPGVDDKTRSGTTIASYRQRGEMLLRRYRRERRASTSIEEFDERDFALWFLSLKPGLKSTTWRFYRQAAIMLLGANPSARSEEALDMIVGDPPQDVEMDPTVSVAKNDGTRVTSSLKAKLVKREDLERIDAWLTLNRRSPSADDLRDWLRAGVATGLRPSEWQATLYVETEDEKRPGGKRIRLYVGNAKATNGRANGVMRTLDLEECTLQTLGAIKRMSENGRAWARLGEFDAKMDGVTQLLYRICGRLWKRRRTVYALYSCRHQFIANMKALGLPNEEISAMVGHVVDETAAQTYGRRQSAWSVDKIVDRPRGVAEEIATVRRRLVLHEERLRLTRVLQGKEKNDDAGPDIDELN